MDYPPYPLARLIGDRSILAAVAAGVLLIAPDSPARAQNGSLLRAPQGPPNISSIEGAHREAGNRASGSSSSMAARAVQQAAAVATQPPAATPPGSRRAPSAAASYPADQYASQGIPLSGASWTYVPPADVRTYQKNDIVTIRVDELSRMQAEGNAESRRNTLYDALLKDWIQLDGFDEVRPAPQSSGDPRVQGTLNQLYRADSSIESRESLTFNIAARIVDVRPNGDLVLEARKTIFVNENVWETELSGVCRPVDIAPDNVVLSRDLLDLQIHKQDRGRLRDGYRRGWFTRWFETLSPF